MHARAGVRVSTCFVLLGKRVHTYMVCVQVLLSAWRMPLSSSADLNEQGGGEAPS